MKRIGWLGCAALALLVSLSSNAQAVGANFNENLHRPIRFAEHLVDEGFEYVRGFTEFNPLLMLDEQQAIIGFDQEAIDTHEPTRRFIDARDASGRQLKLVLSLKIWFKSFSHGVPDIGTPEADLLFGAIERYLLAQSLGDTLSILVLGNEPLFSVPEDNAAAYGAFLDALADRVAAWKAEHGWGFRVYAGALNRASTSDAPILTTVLDLAQRHPHIDGLDLHIHAGEAEELVEDWRVVREEHGFTKELISTEFSIVRLLERHREDELGPWAAANGFDPAMKLHEWLTLATERAAAGDPIPADVFRDCFESRGWYPARWYAALYDAAETYDVYALIGRGFDDAGRRTFHPKTRLWSLGSMFTGRFQGNDAEGRQRPNPLVYPAFRAEMQEASNK